MPEEIKEEIKADNQESKKEKKKGFFGKLKAGLDDNLRQRRTTKRHSRA